MVSKRILVTGGAGFLGSHLCEKLIGLGHQVICVDNLFTGRKANLSTLLGKELFDFVRHDIVQPLLIDVDQIYNLACPASPVHYQLNPVKTIQTNVIGVFNVLELARQTKARILQASTSEVYGDPEVHPQSEEYWGRVNPVGIRSCYDEGKRCAETLLSDYHRQNGVEIRIARIFNTFGPRMAVNDGRVVSNFVIQALRGENITVYGDGKQTRSFCYVDDLMDGLVRLMNYDGNDAATPFNIGNPVEIMIGELASIVCELVNSKAKVVYRPLPKDDPRQRKPDISKASTVLGWTPNVNIVDGLIKTIEYFRSMRV